ncbi:MAG: SusC/RagA family TonB-linked outer membrane protein [Gemmatimonadota bacterium]|nr:SusC/RagA family TonB-linked outer membrane protein [Gemmatimonadota bacterium]
MERVRGANLLNRRPRWLYAAGLSVLFTLAFSGRALSQDLSVSGTVTSTAGAPLSGVTVRVQGTDTRTVTNANGRYFVKAPADAILTFSFVGQRPVQTTVAGRTTVDVTMAQIPYLEEVVVTAYTEQRRGDITGAVSSVNIEAAQKQTGASMLQRLDVAVPGVTVASNGSPGSRSTVRIRGISSFQNNDPLYVIDGTPVEESYLNFLNPDDITSVQVLKDASAASIYGSRASNGVIVIETNKRGVQGAPQTTLRVRTGVTSPVRGYNDILLTNSLDYAAVVKASYLNAGLKVPTNIFGDPNNPTVPAYIYAAPGTATATDAFGRPTAVDASKYAFPNTLIMPGSAGTDWWGAVFGHGQVQDYNLDVNGGSDANAYRVSFNYFNQGGTAIFNDFKRGSVRANTQFNRGKLNFGENVALSVERHYGGMPDDPGGYAEDGILGKNILMQPVIPIFDIAGNYAGGKSNTLGNQVNPVKFAFTHKDDIGKNLNLFGNVFGGLDLTQALSLRTKLGFSTGLNSFAGYSPPNPEVAEATFSNGINENNNQFLDWTWSNTGRFVKALGSHNFDVLLGQEVNQTQSRYISASIGNLLNTSLDSRYIQDALGDATTKNVFSTGGKAALLSVFGKADYNFADKYIATFTVRRDGSSRLAPGHQWGTFPAFGLGWHVSNERFLSGNKYLSDVMLRFGAGRTGNQLIPSGRIVALFGGDRGETYYDVTGSGNTIAAGFRQTSLGNPNLQWEENRSQNLGADMVLFEGMLNVVLDVYRRNTNNLLFDPRLPATAGYAAPPIVNVGKMRNTGFDVSVGHQGSWWNATLNGSHYNNTIVSINGDQTFFYGPISTRFGNQVINQVGSPIGAFYGYIADGFFTDAADVAAHAKQDGAAPGRIKFRDINGDGKIDLTDRTIIGSPHPKFTAGLDLGAHRGNWDATATFFGSYGNKIFENQMEFYVFREFETNVKADLLANSWTPTNLNAKYPRIDVNDTFSRALSSFYVKDGTYTRLRNLQIGYTLPSTAGYLPGARVYVQGDNLFTITSYEGLDPSLPAANVSGAAGDVRDQYRGVDRGSYPSNRIFSVGIVTSF